jgi:hypothetical protein
MKGIRVKIETLRCKQKYICKSVNTPVGKIRTGNLMSCNPMQGIRVGKRLIYDRVK